MRVILASVLLLSAPALAQQKLTDVPPEVLSPTLTRGWQMQPPSLTPEQQTELALRWAEEPSGIYPWSFEQGDRTFSGHRPTTVGQGSR